MQSKTKILVTKALSVTLLILLLIYATFPWWAKIIAREQLPGSWALQTIEFNYPRLSGLMIKQLKINTSEFTANLSNIRLDYKMTQLTVQSLSMTLKTKSGQNQPLKINLPSIEVEKLFHQFPVKQLAIQQAKIHREKETLSLNDLQIKQSSVNQLLVKSSYIESSFSDISGFASAQLTSQNDEISMKLKLNGTDFLDAHYQQDKPLRQLKLDLNPELIMHIYSNTGQLKQVDMQQPVAISYQQDNRTGESQLFIHSQGKVQLPQLNNSWFNYSIVASSQASQFPIKMDIKGHLKSDKDLAVNREIKINKPEMFFNTNLLLSKNQLSIRNSSLELNTSRTELSTNEKRILFNKLQLTTQLNTIDIANPKEINASIERSLLNQLKATTRLKSHSISIFNPDNEQIFKSELNADFTSSGLHEMLISGVANFNSIKMKTTEFKSHGSAQLTFKNINRTMTSGELLLAGTASISSTDYVINAIKTELSANISKQQINGQGNININNKVLFPLTFSSNRKTGANQIDFPWQVFDNPKLSQLQSLLKETQIEKSSLPAIQLTRGKLKHKASLKNKDSTTLTSQLTAKNISLKIKDITLNKVNLKSESHFIPSLVNKSKIEIQKVQISDDLELKNLTSRLIFKNRKNFKLNQLNFNLMSGQIKVDELSVVNGKIKPALLQVSHLSLANVVNYMDIDGLSVEGHVDMSLPLKTKDKLAIIHNGSFHNIDSGIIRYEQGDKLNLTDNIALKALKNFHFTQLDGSINYGYNSDGNLAKHPVKVHLIGANPDLYGGTPVELTLNLDIDFSEVIQLIENLLFTQSD